MKSRNDDPDTLLEALLERHSFVPEEGSEPLPGSVESHEAQKKLWNLLGQLEGLRAKNQGLLSQEVLGLVDQSVRPLGYELEAGTQLRLPFSGKILKFRSIPPKSEIHEDKLLAFVTGMLSAYAIEPLALESQGKGRWKLVADEGSKGEPAVRPSRFLHQLQNHLGGILSFSSLILSEMDSDSDPALRERIELIQESAEKSRDLLERTFPKPRPG